MNDRFAYGSVEDYDRMTHGERTQWMRDRQVELVRVCRWRGEYFALTAPLFLVEGAQSLTVLDVSSDFIYVPSQRLNLYVSAWNTHVLADPIADSYPDRMVDGSFGMLLQHVGESWQLLGRRGTMITDEARATECSLPIVMKSATRTEQQAIARRSG